MVSKANELTKNNLEFINDLENKLDELEEHCTWIFDFVDHDECYVSQKSTCPVALARADFEALRDLIDNYRYNRNISSNGLLSW